MLITQIEEAIKDAMRAKHAAQLRALRSIKSVILLKQTEKGGKKELSPTEECEIIDKLIKQRKEAIHIFQTQDRKDLARKEEEEMACLQNFLPSPLSKAEVVSIIEAKVKELSIDKDVKQAGRVFGAIRAQVLARYDTQEVMAMIQAYLGT